MCLIQGAGKSRLGWLGALHLVHYKNQQLSTDSPMLKFCLLSINNTYVTSTISLLSNCLYATSLCATCSGSLPRSPLFPLKAYLSPSPVSLNNCPEPISVIAGTMLSWHSRSLLPTQHKDKIKESKMAQSEYCLHCWDL